MVMDTPVRTYIDKLFFERPPEISSERMLMIRNARAVERAVNGEWNTEDEEDPPDEKASAIRERH